MRTLVVSISKLKASENQVHIYKSKIFLYSISEHLEFEIQQPLTTWRETHGNMEKHHSECLSWTFQPSPATSQMWLSKIPQTMPHGTAPLSSAQSSKPQNHKQIKCLPPPPTLGIVFRANYKWDRFAGIQWRPASAAQLMTSQESETSMLSACPIESEMEHLNLSLQPCH